MNFVRVIDENGVFVEDAFVKELTEFTIETPVPQGFYRPKWDGEQWIESLSQEQIDELNNQPVELSVEQEKVKLLEQQLKQTNEDMNMFMDFVLSGGM